MPRTISTYSGKSLALELRVRLVEQLMSYGDGTSELEVAEITLLIDNLDDLLDLGPRLDLLYPAGKLENAGIHDAYAGHIVAPRSAAGTLIGVFGSARLGATCVARSCAHAPVAHDMLAASESTNTANNPEMRSSHNLFSSFPFPRTVRTTLSA